MLKQLSHFIVILGCCLVVFCCLNENISYEYSHLAAGKQIWKEGSWLLQDPVSYQSLPTVGLNSYWVGELCLYFLQQASFLAPLLFFALATALAFFCLLSPSLPWHTSLLLLLLLLATAIVPQQHHIHLFAPLFTLLLFVAVKFSCQTFSQGKQLVILPLLFLLWANTHPSCLLGVLLLCLIFIRESKGQNLAWGYLLASALAVLVTPQGYEIFSNSWQLLFSSALPIALLSSVASGIVGWFLLYSPPLFVTFLSRRFSLAAVLLLLPVFGWHFYQFSQQPASLLDKELTPLKKLLVAKNWPKKAFNHPILGGFLSYWHANYAFSDLRHYRYLKDQRQQIAKVDNDPKYFQELARRFGIHIAFLDHRRYSSNHLLNSLAVYSKWQPVYMGGVVAVFISPDLAAQQDWSQQQISDGVLPEQSLASAQDHYQRALAFFDMEMITNARKDWQQAQRQQPQHPFNYLLAGRFALLEGNYQKAQQELQKSLQLDPNSPDTLELYINTLIQIDTPKTLQQASHWIDHARDNFPETVEFDYQLAVVTSLQGDQATASIILKDILARYPDHSRAQLFLESIEKEVAQANLRERLEKAKILADSKRFTQALRVLDKLIKEEPDYVEAYLQAGIITRKQESYVTSCQYFAKAIKKAPDNIFARNQLILTLVKMGQWREAEKILVPILQKEEKPSPETLESLRVFEQAATSDLRSQIKKDPENFSLRFDLARVLARANRYQEAISVLEEFPVQNKEFRASLYYGEARQLIPNGRVKDGMARLRKSIEIWPGYLEAHTFLADIALKLQDWETARKHYQKIQELAPNSSLGSWGMAQIHLGKAMRLQIKGKLAQAIPYFEKYLHAAPAGEERESVAKRLANLRKKLKKQREQQLDKKLQQLTEQGVEALRQQNWSEAIAAFRQKVKLQPAAASYFNLSIALRGGGKAEEAKEALLKVVELDPDFAPAYLNLGNHFYFQQQFEQAKHYFQKFLNKIDPQDPSAQFVARVEEIIQFLEAHQQQQKETKEQQ